MSKSINAIIVKEEEVLSKIFLIRGRKVMLDRDLAYLYGVKSIRLREQVKRNSERFPESFMFQLSEDEVDFLVSQNAIPSKKHLGGFLQSHKLLLPICHKAFRTLLSQKSIPFTIN